MRPWPENSPGLVGVHTLCKSHLHPRADHREQSGSAALAGHQGGGLHPTPGLLIQGLLELWHLLAQHGQLSPGLEAKGSSCTHTCAKVCINQSVAVRLWVSGLVPVWVKDEQMLSLGKATSKDQGLPQCGTKLLYSASLP